MNASETSYWAKPFSHIYMEPGVEAYPLAKRILARLTDATRIPIPHYKDVFNRAGQDFLGQKRSPSLILAINHGERIYPGARVCQSFGSEHFYYCSNLFNCIYDCEYCYLQGMYPCGHIVVFVNIEDYFADIEAILKEHPMYICISYDTDLLAMEGLLGLVDTWSKFTEAHKDLSIEVRTKSAADLAYLGLSDCERIYYAWTLSPTEVIALEHKTPSLEARLQAIKKAAERGYTLRLCFDPMIRIPNWKDAYRRLYEAVFSKLSPSCIKDASIGVFRISSSYLKSMRKKRTCAITAYPYETTRGVSSYAPVHSIEMLTLARKELSAYLALEQIFETDF